MINEVKKSQGLKVSNYTTFIMSFTQLGQLTPMIVTSVAESGHHGQTYIATRIPMMELFSFEIPMIKIKVMHGTEINAQYIRVFT
jgi:hypothetical protein